MFQLNNFNITYLGNYLIANKKMNKTIDNKFWVGPYGVLVPLSVKR